MADGTSQIHGLNEELEKFEKEIERKSLITPTNKRHENIKVRTAIIGGQCVSGPQCNCNCQCASIYYGYNCYSKKQCTPSQCSTRQCTPFTDINMETLPSNIIDKRKTIKKLIAELINDIHVHEK